MAEPCETLDCVEPAAVRRQGCLRWLLALFLLALGLLMLRYCGPGPQVNETIIVSVPTLAAVAPTTTPTATPAPTETAVPTETTVPPTATPVPIAALMAGNLVYAAEADNLSWAGTGNAGYIVKLIGADGTAASEAPIDAAGNWTFDTTPALVEGDNCFTVQMFDESGALVEASAERCITLQPAFVMAELAADPADFSYDQADGQADGIAMWAGSGQPEYTVQMLDNTGGEIITATVATDGNWAAEAAINLPPGEQCITMQMVDLDGNVIAESEAACITIAAAEKAPLIVAVDQENPNAISGSYEPGTILMFASEDGTSLGDASVQEDGTFAGTCELPPGEYAITVQDEAGAASETVTIVVEGAPVFSPPTTGVDFVCEGVPPRGKLEGNIYTIAPCEYAGLIAERLGTTIDGLRLYNPHIRNFSLIYGGQQIIVPADASCFDIHN